MPQQPIVEAEQTVPLPTSDQIDSVRAYIKRTWKTLTRSHDDLLAALPDPKLHHNANEPWILYVAADVDPNAIRAQLTDELGPEAMRQVNVQTLPPNPREHVRDITPGLLYLPKPYVVPGGRFNEMYGWDSYFIQVGLLEDGELQLAKDMIDNFIYEIQHYGTILNASRTYFLTRSQPPFLTPMILGVYEKTQDKEWLASTLPAIEKQYAFWVTAPHLAGDTGLSRYWDFGEGPAPEAVSDERDAEGNTHYDRVKEYFRTHVVTDYDESVYYDSTRDMLTPLFFKGDRSMRESGFDPSNRFGPFNVDIIHYAPVGLNALLYQMEGETAQIYDILGRDAEADTWRQRAAHRKELI
ncbi:MAG TPA: trehalase family glycosidase, partial [Rhodothermales bacterium]|nr:trehalase family glycosidase [Rhodothermales bacterium]